MERSMPRFKLEKPMHESQLNNMLNKRNGSDCDTKKQSNIKNISYRSKQASALCSSNPFHIPDRLRLFGCRRKPTVRKSKPEQFVMSDPKSICDIDETFYQIVEGRPLRHFYDINVYINNLQYITLFKASAFSKELIIQMDTSMVDELRQYEKINDLYVKTRSNFIKFVKEKYIIAQRLHEQAEQKSQELKAMIDQLSALSFTCIKLRNETDSLIVTFENLSKYGHFLNSLSPHWWRIMYDKDFEENKLLFSTFFSDSLSPSASLMSVYKANEKLFKNLPPKIFFKKPHQLIRIYDSVSEQCLNYMQIECYSSDILRSVLKSRDHIKIKVAADINEMENFTTFYEEQVKRLEEKEMAYKNKFNRILFTEFKELYCSFKSKHLYTCVQYVHTQLLGGPEDPKDSIVTLAANIENMYINFTSKFDCLNQDIVNQVRREVFADDIKNMKRAFKAQRTLREYEILKKSLIKSFEPPRYKNKCNNKYEIPYGNFRSTL